MENGGALFQLLQDMTLSCVAHGRAGHSRLPPCVLVGRAWIEVTESELHDVSYLYQGTSLRRLRINGQAVLADAPLILTGALAPVAPR